VGALLLWAQNHWPTLYGLLLSVVIAWLRMTYSGGTGRQRALESALCCAIALAVMSGLDWFGLPGTASGFVGGAIGFLGVEKIRDIAGSLIDRKISNEQD